MKATALRGRLNQKGNCEKSPATPSEIREREADKRALLSEWCSYAESLGLRRRSAKRLVNFYANHITGDFSDFESWVIQYLDPTGETAVRNIMRAGGGAA